MDQFDKKVGSKMKRHAENTRFTETDRDRITKKIAESHEPKRRFQPVYWMVLTAAASLFAVLGLSLFNDQQGLSGEDHPPLPADMIYDGRELVIGVIGEIPEQAYPPVTFEDARPEELRSNSGYYDAFFVTEAYFEELSGDEWTQVFDSLRTPVFFLNANSNALVFLSDGTTYGPGAWEATTNTEGFVAAPLDDSSGKNWGYYDPTESEDPDDVPELVYHLMFRDIEAYWDSIGAIPLPEQLSAQQPNFTRIVGEADTAHGKLVFFELKDGNEASGAGLALFRNKAGNWIYSASTSHMVSESSVSVSHAKDRLLLNDHTEVVYSYTGSEELTSVREAADEENLGESEPGTITFTVIEK